MILKIVTDCNYAGCEQVHYVEVSDSITQDEIDALCQDYLESDVCPTVNYEEVSEDEREEIEESGYEIE